MEALERGGECVSWREGSKDCVGARLGAGEKAPGESRAGG